jgi:hypothetical protein
MGTGSFPVVKRPGRGVDHPPPPRAEVKEKVELYIYSPPRFRGLFCGEIYFIFTYNIYNIKTTKNWLYILIFNNIILIYGYKFYVYI